MHDLPTMEEQLKNAPLQSIRDEASHYAIFDNIEYTHPDGSVMTRKQWYWAMKREEPMFDRLTIQMAEHERALLNPREGLPEWLLTAELASYERQSVKRLTA